ncbi:hypothetical protein N0V82_009230 [Gnomoniopsis sp. IMI 355080]|nr:hypothetical protein N0V82_009230 [Gnomoniopsis sp. IMI 355080]
MSAHRAKRPFAGAASDPSQRQITSFFNKATPGSSSEQQPAIVLRPVLPADTESNLLTVGMRVRKSVPEGYKTGSSYSAFGLFNDAAEERHKQQQQPQQRPANQPPRSSYTTAHRELLPFCAIHSVGGLAAQPPSPPLIRHDSVDDVPSLSSSQSSIASSTTATEPLNIGTSFPRKRSHDAGDESDTPSISGCLQVPSGEWMDGQVSPRSLVPVGWENTRVMAVPKRARQSLKMRGAPAVVIAGEDDKAWTGLGQENMRMVVDEDFPEADFLDYTALEGDAMEL